MAPSSSESIQPSDEALTPVLAGAAGMGTEELCYLHVLRCKGLLPLITFLTGKQTSVSGLGEDFTVLKWCPKGSETGEAGESPWEGCNLELRNLLPDCWSPKRNLYPCPKCRQEESEGYYFIALIESWYYFGWTGHVTLEAFCG